MHSNRFPVTGSGVSRMMHSSSVAQVSLSQMAKTTYEMNVSNNFEVHGVVDKVMKAKKNTFPTYVCIQTDCLSQGLVNPR